MNIYDVISERFKGLDYLLENESLGEDDWFNHCTKLTEVLLELAKRGTEREHVWLNKWLTELIEQCEDNATLTEDLRPLLQQLCDKLGTCQPLSSSSDDWGSEIRLAKHDEPE